MSSCELAGSFVVLPDALLMRCTACAARALQTRDLTCHCEARVAVGWCSTLHVHAKQRVRLRKVASTLGGVEATGKVARWQCTCSGWLQRFQHCVFEIAPPNVAIAWSTDTSMCMMHPSTVNKNIAI